MGNGSQLFGLASELTYLNTKSFISVEKGGNYFKQEYDRYSYLKLYGILEILEIMVLNLGTLFYWFMVWRGKIGLSAEMFLS